MSFDFDLVTIGAGSGGVAASRRAARHGAKVAICESRAVGGTCVLRGCVPKKLLVYASELRPLFADAAAFGWDIAGVCLDWGALIAAKNREIARLEGVYERMLETAAVTTLRGHARIVDPHTVEVGERQVTAQTILVATGGRPYKPGIVGAELTISSDEALSLPALPRHVTIVGAGYIAVEFAGIFASAGADVTLLVRGDGVLRGFDQDIRTVLLDELRAAGIDVRLHETIEAVERHGSSLRVITGSGAAIASDAVLTATGRVPNTEGIGLLEVGVGVDSAGAIEVDEASMTALPSIYAIGDCTARPNLTPMAIADGRAFADSVFGGRPRTNIHAHVATAVFSQPPVGTVGLTEGEARARGPVRVFRSQFRPMRHAFVSRNTQVMVKLVVDAITDVVLGVHIVGTDAPEIVQGFAVAVHAGATKAQFDATLAIHPTIAEELVTMMEPVG